MKKSTALALLGGTVATAAEAIGVSHATIHQWPAVLPRKQADRVIAARIRQEWGDAVRLRLRVAPDDEHAALLVDALS